MKPSLALAPQLSGRVLVGQLSAAPVAVGPAGHALELEIGRFVRELRQEHAARSPRERGALGPARELYRLFGIDPTKIRPSSESLLRRVLRGEELPRISNAVDLGNYLGLRFLLPIGLYDGERIEGPVVLRAGAPGEAYVGVRKDEVHLAGRPVLADRCGPFGNPTADSLRTAVTSATRALWLVVFAPASFPAERLAADLALARAAFVNHLAPAGEAVETASSVVG